MLVLAAVLAATSVAAVGVVGFLGLVAPHAARALVGSKHVRVIGVSMLLGAVLLGLADTSAGRYRPGADPRRPGRRPDRRALLRLPAGAFADPRLTSRV